MATEVRELRIKARKLGADNVREMSKRELEDFIEENSSRRNGSKKKGAVKAVKASKPAKRGRPRKVRDEDDEDEAPRKRGRPKGSKNKTTAKRGRPAKTEARTTKKRKSSGGPGRPAGSGPGTRVLLSDKINWNKNFDFREGSIQDYILSEIRKAADKTSDTSEIRERVFNKLVDKIGKRDELTFMNRATGKPHKGEMAENRLKYYISRTMFDYAVNTGQHEGAGESSASRPRDGGSTTKSKTKRGRPRKVRDEDDEDEEERPRKRGRPKGSTNKKRGPGRPKGSKNKSKDEPKKKRGRPKGSKNKR